jgi:gentisate 1,2-dioxygenase
MPTATTTTTTKPSQESFLDSLNGKNVAPLWTVMSKMVPPYPNPKATPTIWRYSDMKPALLESGKVVGAQEAERRVLMLVNPTMGPYQL